MTAERAFQPLSIAVLTVSDTRTEATDKSGAYLAAQIEKTGHKLRERAIVGDDIYAIRARVSQWIAARSCAKLRTASAAIATERLESVHRSGQLFFLQDSAASA